MQLNNQELQGLLSKSSTLAIGSQCPKEPAHGPQNRGLDEGLKQWDLSAWRHP